jgi:hypothetical protein
VSSSYIISPLSQTTTEKCSYNFGFPSSNEKILFFPPIHFLSLLLFLELLLLLLAFVEEEQSGVSYLAGLLVEIAIAVGVAAETPRARSED